MRTGSSADSAAVHLGRCAVDAHRPPRHRRASFIDHHGTAYAFYAVAIPDREFGVGGGLYKAEALRNVG